ncbi:26S proteasome non-ATPase regulatory subunit 10 [Heterocephalus glaber]|uniref:26S proteasome non-ATPase regulatory subunit 10 n=1 Tax=Heterocephalus glaber TaxID=10181 RepID=G5CAC9_HETGA|nr:26S proteasome non-ATPase regulatory subunit 10 [Heterocephalus glaber]
MQSYFFPRNKLNVISQPFLRSATMWEAEELKESILASKSLATRTNQDSQTALHRACHTKIVEFLLQLSVPVNDKDTARWPPLHIAASASRDEIVKALLGKGAQVNAVNQSGCTPLHYAASKNRQEIAVMLLEGGANPDAKDHYEATSNALGSNQG